VFDHLEDGLSRQFKFAGIEPETDEIVIGHFDGQDLLVDSRQPQSGLDNTPRTFRVLLDAQNVVVQLRQSSGQFVTRATHSYATAFPGSIGLGSRAGRTAFDNFRVREVGATDALITETFSGGAAERWAIERGLWTNDSGVFTASTARLELGDALLVDRATLTANLDVDFDRDPALGPAFDPQITAEVTLSDVDALLIETELGGTALFPNDPGSPRGLIVANDLEVRLAPGGVTFGAGRFSAGFDQFLFLDLFGARLDFTDNPDANLFEVACVELRVPPLAVDPELPLATLRQGSDAFARCGAGEASPPVIGVSKPTAANPIPTLRLLQSDVRVELNLGNIRNLDQIIGFFPLQIDQLGLVFNDVNDMGDFDLVAKVQVDPGLLNDSAVDVILAIGAPLEDGQSCPSGVDEISIVLDQPQRFCNGAIDVRLHLPGLVGDGPLFEQLGPFVLGIEDLEVASGVFVDAAIAIDEIRDGQFAGAISGRVLVANSATINDNSDFVEVTVGGTVSDSPAVVDAQLRSQFTSLTAAQDGLQATISTAQIRGTARGQAGLDAGPGLGADITFELLLANAEVDGDPINLALEASIDSISTTFTIPLGDPREPLAILSGTGTLNLDAGPDEPAVVLDSVNVEFGPGLEALDGLVIEAGGIGLGTDLTSVFILPPTTDASGVEHPGFHFRLATTGNDDLLGTLFGIPDWFPVDVNGIGLKFHGQGVTSSGEVQQPVKLINPSNFSLLISGGIPAESPLLPFSGSFTDLEIDLGLLAVYDPQDPSSEFPIVNISGVTIGIDEFAFPDENGMKVSGQIGFGQAEGVVFARLDGAFDIKGVSGGIALVISEVGPLLARIEAPVGMPLGPTGIILKSVEGGLVFGEDLVPDVTEPVELISNPAFVDVLELSDQNIVSTLARVQSDSAISTTWELPFTLGARGNFTTLASPGIIEGEVIVAMNIGARDDRDELLNLKLLASGEVTIYGLPIGQAGLLLDLDNPIDPQFDLAFAAPPPGNPLGFLFPATGTFTMHFSAGGLIESPLVGLRRVLDTLLDPQQLLSRISDAELRGLLTAIPQAIVDAAAALRNSSDARRLFDANNDNLVSDDELTVESFVLRLRQLLPPTFDELASQGTISDDALKFAESLLRLTMNSAGRVAAQAADDAAVKAARSASIMREVLAIAAEVVRDEAVLALQRINPQLEIRGLIQPTILGFPIGPPTEEVLVLLAKDPTTQDFKLAFGVTTSLRETLKRQVNLISGGLGGLLIDLITLGAEDRLNFQFQRVIPTGLLTAMLTGKSTDNRFDDVFEQLVDVLNPFTGWEVGVSGELFWLGMKLGSVSGLVFGPQDQDGNGTVDDPNSIFSRRVVNMDRNGNDQVDPGERDFPVGVPADAIPVFSRSKFEKMVDFGGFLVTAQLNLPRMIVEPFEVLREIGAPPELPNVNFNQPLSALSQVGEVIDAYSSKDRRNRVTGAACAESDIDSNCVRVGYIPRIIDGLTSTTSMGGLQIYVPSPATLLNLDYLNFKSERGAKPLMQLQASVEQAQALFSSFFIEGFLEPRLLGIPLGETFVQATTTGYKFRSSTPLLAGITTEANIGVRDVNPGEFLGSVLQNPLVAGVAAALPLPIDKFSDLLRRLTSGVTIPIPVASLEVSAGTDNLRNWLTTNLGFSDEVVSSLITPTGSRAGVNGQIFFGAYSPGVDLDAPHPLRDEFGTAVKPFDDVKRYGGFRIDATLNLGDFIENARFFLEAELVPSSLSSVLGLRDFVALARIDRIRLGSLVTPSLLETHMLGELIKEGDCASLRLAGGITLLQTLSLDAAGTVIVDLGGCPDSDGVGLYGAAELRLHAAPRSRLPKLVGDGFELEASLQLQVNSTGDARDVVLDAGPLAHTVTLDPGTYVQLFAQGSLVVLGFPVADGSFVMRSQDNLLVVGGAGAIDLGPLGAIAAEGGLAMVRKPNRIDLAAALGVSINSISGRIGPVDYVLDGQFDFEANTSTQDITIPFTPPIVIDGDPHARLHIGGPAASDNPTTDRDETKAFLSLFGGALTAEGLLDMEYRDQTLSLAFDAELNLLGGLLSANVRTLDDEPILIGPFGIEGSLAGSITLFDDDNDDDENDPRSGDQFVARLDRFGCLRTNILFLEEINLRGDADPHACEQHVYLEVTSRTVSEGPAGSSRSMAINVLLSEPPSSPLTLEYTVEGKRPRGPGSAGSDDFSLVSRNPLVIDHFITAQVAAQIIVDIVGDNRPEFDEALQIILDAASYEDESPVHLDPDQDAVLVTIEDDDCASDATTFRFTHKIGVCGEVSFNPVQVSVTTNGNLSSRLLSSRDGGDSEYQLTTVESSGPLMVRAEFLNPGDEVTVAYAVVTRSASLTNASIPNDVVLDSGTVTLRRSSFDNPASPSVDLQQLVNDSILEMHEELELGLAIVHGVANRAQLPSFAGDAEVEAALRDASLRETIVVGDRTVLTINNDDPVCGGTVVCYSFDKEIENSNPRGPFYEFTQQAESFSELVNVTPFIHSNDRRGALRFDGLNDVVRTTLLAPLPASQITVEFWMLPQIASAGTLLNLGDGLEIYLTRGRDVSWRFKDLGGKRIEQVFATLPDGGWQHLAISFDGNTLRGYLNGEQVISRRAEGGIHYLNDQLVLGASSSAGAKAYRGALDELRIWTTARSHQEISGFRSQILEVPLSQLLLYWRMDEGRAALAGPLVADLSGLSHHGRFTLNESQRPSRLDEGAPLKYFSALAGIGLDRVDPGAKPDFNTPAIRANQWQTAEHLVDSLPNLLKNPGETAGAFDVPDWEELTGGWQARTFASISAVDGVKYFHGGTFETKGKSTAVLEQFVDVNHLASRIDASIQEFAFTGYVRSLAQPRGVPVDSGQIQLLFLDQFGVPLGRTLDSKLITSVRSWEVVRLRGLAPAGTRGVLVRLLGHDNAPLTTVQAPAIPFPSPLRLPSLGTTTTRTMATADVLFDAPTLQALEPAYFEFTVTPSAIALANPQVLSIAAVDFWNRVPTGGPARYELRGILDDVPRPDRFLGLPDQSFDQVIASGPTSAGEFGHQIQVSVGGLNCYVLLPPMTYRLYPVVENRDQLDDEWRIENFSLFLGSDTLQSCFQPPVAQDDQEAIGGTPLDVGQGGTLEVRDPGLLINDDLGDGTSVIVEVAVPPQHGSVVVGGDGSFVYSPDPDFTGPSDGFTYRIRNLFGSSDAEVTIGVIANAPPVANAGPDTQQICFGDVILVGTASDPNGDSLTRSWAQISGPTATITVVNSSTIRVDPPAVNSTQNLVFRFTVSDGFSTVFDDVVVTVHPDRPLVASATGTTFGQLNGQGSDPDGCAVTFLWSFVSATPQGSVSVNNAASALASFTPAAQEPNTTLTFSFMVAEVNSTNAMTIPVTVIYPADPDGIALDGPLSQAVVFLDANQNGKLDFDDSDLNGIYDRFERGEPATTTDAAGVFLLPYLPAFDLNGNGKYDASEGSKAILGGVDTTTGLPFSLMLEAPADARIISPLTTLLVAVMRLSGRSVAGANALMSTLLDLAEVDVTQFSPFPAMSTDAADARRVLAAQATIHNAISLIAHGLTRDGGLDAVAIGRLGYQEMARAMLAASNRIDLKSAPFWHSIADATARTASVSVSPNASSAIVTLIVASSEKVAGLTSTLDADYVDRLAQIQQVVQGDAAASLIAAARSEIPYSTVQDNFSGANLTLRVEQARVGDVDPPRITIEDVLALEGSGVTTQFVFTVRLSKPALLPVSVEYFTQDGSARVQDGDFSSTAGTLLFEPGSTEQRFTVAVTADRIAEPNEFFMVHLANANHATLAASSGQGHILDDDGVPAVASGDQILIAVSGQPVMLDRELTGVTMSEITAVIVDWGNGRVTTPYLVERGGRLIASGESVYLTEGDFAIRVIATLRDARQVAFTTPVSVRRVAAGNDPRRPRESVLTVGGTTESDQIELQSAQEGIIVRRNGESFGPFTVPSRIAVFSHYGDDRIVVHGIMTIPLVVYAGAGDDFVEAGEGSDFIDAGAGDDLVRGEGGADLILGQAGDDLIESGDGDDQVEGGPGNDVIFGGDGSDLLRGNDDNDQVFGGSGDDLLYAGLGTNRLDGGPGSDILILEGGDDRLFNSEQDLTLVDGPDLPLGRSDLFQLANSLRSPQWWHNLANAHDVSDDGIVAPLDAILIINHLNALGSGRLTDLLGIPAVVAPPFVDVDGNDLLAPLDAILVINVLNERARQASGEPPQEWPGTAPGSSLVENASRITKPQSAPLIAPPRPAEIACQGEVGIDDPWIWACATDAMDGLLDLLAQDILGRDQPGSE